MASSNCLLVVRLTVVLILLLGVTTAAVPRESDDQDTRSTNRGLLRRLQRCFGGSCDPTNTSESSANDSTSTASDLLEPLEPMDLHDRGNVNFENLLWSPLRNVSAPLMVASERLSQEAAAALEEVPGPVEKLFPSLRLNRSFFLPSTAEIAGLAMKNGDTGLCDKETTYKFTNMDQLKGYRAEAECIYARGVAPDRPPLGIWDGQVIEIINTDAFNLLTERLWTGKMSVKTQCKGNHPENSEIYLLHNFVGNRMSKPAYMYTGTLRDPLAPGEYDDGKRHLFVDYVVDFAQVCPQPKTGNLNVGVMNDPWPISQLIDMVRKIGEQEDGGSILLGKSIIRDTWGFPEVGDTTVAFWSVINYDNEAWPYRENWTLGPLEKSFSWYHMSGTENIARLVSLDDFIRNPTLTSLGTLNEIVRKPHGQPNLGKEWSRRHQEFLMAGNPDRPEDQISETTNYLPSADGLSERPQSLAS